MEGQFVLGFKKIWEKTKVKLSLNAKATFWTID